MIAPRTAAVKAYLDTSAILKLTNRWAKAAAAVAEGFALRALDAIHLASALAGDDRDTVMVTWDRELAAAARRAGLGLAGLSTASS